jgi:hypothetical protein
MLVTPEAGGGTVRKGGGGHDAIRGGGGGGGFRGGGGGGLRVVTGGGGGGRRLLGGDRLAVGGTRHTKADRNCTHHIQNQGTCGPDNSGLTPGPSLNTSGAVCDQAHSLWNVEAGINVALLYTLQTCTELERFPL